MASVTEEATSVHDHGDVAQAGYPRLRPDVPESPHNHEVSCACCPEDADTNGEQEGSIIENIAQEIDRLVAGMEGCATHIRKRLNALNVEASLTRQTLEQTGRDWAPVYSEFRRAEENLEMIEDATRRLQTAAAHVCAGIHRRKLQAVSFLKSQPDALS